MTLCYVGLGSNIDRDRMIRSGLLALQREFGELTCSSVYLAPAQGFTGTDFYNLVAGFDTELDVKAVAEKLRAIEFEHGRKADSRKLTSRTLDLDLLLYGDLICNNQGLTLPRQDIKQYAFVLAPLAEIAPKLTHPVDGICYADMWANFAKTGLNLQRLDLRLLKAG